MVLLDEGALRDLAANGTIVHRFPHFARLAALLRPQRGCCGKRVRRLPIDFNSFKVYVVGLNDVDRKELLRLAGWAMVRVAYSVGSSVHDVILT
jgi:hypothetical protein